MVLNPEAIGVFGLFTTVICFGLEQIGVGINEKTDHAKLSRTLAYVAIVFGGCCQIFASFFMFLFSAAGPDHSKFLGTVFGFFGMFWILAGLFFLKGGDKKVMAHFFFTGLILVCVFTVYAFQNGLVWPLGVDLVVIIALLVNLIFGWYTEKPIFTKLAGVCNLLIGAISFFLLYPHIL